MKIHLKQLIPIILLFLFVVPVSANLITGLAIYNTKDFNHHFQSLTNLEPNILINEHNDDIIIKEVWINVRKNTKSSDMKITQMERLPVSLTTLDTPIYKSFEIQTSNILPSNTAPSKIIFAVSKSWISENSIDITQIVLKTYNDGTWLTLDTKTTGTENNIEIQFEAITPLFLKYYTITGKKSTTIIPTISDPILIKETKTTVTTEIPTTSGKDISVLSLIIILITLIAFFGMKKKPETKKPKHLTNKHKKHKK